jgi:hypothetical protein
MSGKISLVHVRACNIKLVQVSSCYARIGHVMSM